MKSGDLVEVIRTCECAVEPSRLHHFAIVKQMLRTEIVCVDCKRDYPLQLIAKLDAHWCGEFDYWPAAWLRVISPPADELKEDLREEIKA